MATDQNLFQPLAAPAISGDVLWSLQPVPLSGKLDITILVSADMRRAQYVLHTNDGRWCKFAILLDDTERHLISFGGSIWPGELPDVFSHYGPDHGLCTYRSGPRVRDGVRLPNITETRS